MNREEFMALESPKKAEELNALIDAGKSQKEAMAEIGVTLKDLMATQVLFWKNRGQVHLQGRRRLFQLPQRHHRRSREITESHGRRRRKPRPAHRPYRRRGRQVNRLPLFSARRPRPPTPKTHPGDRPRPAAVESPLAGSAKRTADHQRCVCARFAACPSQPRAASANPLPRALFTSAFSPRSTRLSTNSEIIAAD